MNVKLHLGMYRRYLWEDQGLLVVLGEFSKVLESKEIYERRHGIAAAPGRSEQVLEAMMAAAVLAALSLARRESWGWTATLPGIGAGFFCGVEPEGMVCGRIRQAQLDAGIVHVQRQRVGGPVVQSHYEPVSADPVAAVQRYFEHVEQIRTRIALGQGGQGVLVQCLPQGRFEEIDRVPAQGLVPLFFTMAGKGELKILGEVVVFYECRCNEKLILDLVASIPNTRKKDIFSGEPSIEIECPRCGREYKVKNGRAQL